MAELDRRLADLVVELEPLLGPLRGEPVALGGGITNRNYRAAFGDGDFVVRVTSTSSDALEIDRYAEDAANRQAAKLGIAPEVVAFLPDSGCIVTRFVAAREIPVDELQSPAMLGRVAAALRRFHGSQPIRGSFDALQLGRSYAQTAAAYGVQPPAGYAEAMAAAEQVRAVSLSWEHDPVPCHNDLLNANFLLSSERLVIIDWEYAGMGDRWFDLGNLSVNNGFGDEADLRLLEAYWREPATEARVARLKLARLLSDLREALWGTVQLGASELDFDYAGYARTHLDRLLAAAADPRFPSWLEAARG